MNGHRSRFRPLEHGDAEEQPVGATRARAAGTEEAIEDPHRLVRGAADRHDLRSDDHGVGVRLLRQGLELLKAPLDAGGEPLELRQDGLAVLPRRGLCVLHAQLEGAELDPEATVAGWELVGVGQDRDWSCPLDGLEPTRQLVDPRAGVPRTLDRGELLLPRGERVAQLVDARAELYDVIVRRAGGCNRRSCGRALSGRADPGEV